jgi:hypothetical protein
MVAERQGHRAGEVLDGGDLFKDLLESRLGVDVGTTLAQRSLDAIAPGVVADKPIKRINLQIKQIWNFHWFGDLRERDTSGR